MTHAEGKNVQAEGLPWVPIAATIAMMAVFAITMGLTYPLLSLVLEAQGVDASMIGLNAAMTPLGIICSAPFIPKLAARYGAWNLAIVFSLMTAILLLLLGAFPNLALWFVLRFLLGIAIDGLFIISETWINQMATRETRGRVMGLYTTMLASGFAIGPFIISVTGSEGYTPFLIGGLAPLLILPLLLRVRGRVPEFAVDDRASILNFARMAPILMAGVGIMALFDSAALSLMPIYGLREGLSETTAAAAVGVLVAGNIVFQFPIGWLADKTHRRGLMVVCTLLAIAGCAALPLVIHSPLLLWPLLFVWGAMAFGIYPVAMAELGDRFSGSMLLAGNAGFAVMWGVGGIVGAPVAGTAIQTLGPQRPAPDPGSLLWRLPTDAALSAHLKTQRTGGLL